MTAQGHIFLATGVTGAVMYALHLPVDIYFLLGIIIGAVLPDIDEPKSFIGRKLFFLAAGLRAIGLKHRTLSHSVIFALIFILPAFIVPSPYKNILFGLGIGSILHCVGDLFTISGLKYFLYPIKKELHLSPKPLRFRTGGAVEQVIILLLVLFNIWIFKKLNLMAAFHQFNQTGVSPFLHQFFNYFLHFLKLNH